MSSRDRSGEAGNLRFLDFKPINISAICMRISEVICRSEEEGVYPDDLDDLRSELLIIQDVLQRRVQDLSEETEALNELQEKPTQASPSLEKKKSSASSAVGTAHNKRREPEFGPRLTTDTKRTKLASADPSSTASSPAPAATSSQTRKAAGSDSGTDKKSKVKVKQSKPEQVVEAEAQFAKTKQDTTNKFWAAVEQYCAPITEQDIKSLRQLAVAPDTDQDLYKIPPLGKHYSYRWAQEDIGDDDKAASRAGTGAGAGGSNVRDKTRSLSSSTSPANSASQPTNGSADNQSVTTDEDSSRQETCSLGPLTQRLVSALLEDKALVGPDVSSSTDAASPAGSTSTAGDSGGGGGGGGDETERHLQAMPQSSAVSGVKDSSSDKKHSPKHSPHHVPDQQQQQQQRNWVVTNAKLLESRIHEQLIHLGLMEADEVVAPEDEEDEVLAELRKRQSELKAVSEYNRQLKHALLQRAEMELEKQLLQEKVRKIDSELIDSLKKVTVSKQRKKPLARKERDAAYNALTQRASLVKRLDQLCHATDNLFSSSMPT